MWNRSHNDGIFFHIIISFIDYVKVGETLKHYLIAHDLGTSGDKATLFDVEGNLIRSVTTPYETHFFNANWAEQNPQNWWDAFCASTKQLVCEIDAKEVAAVSFSGQMMGCVPVDMSGKAIRPAIIWADQRSTAQADALLEQIPAQEFYRITGHRASASYSIEKLMWIRDHEPDSFSRIYRTLQPKDYLVCKLTGRFVTDYSDASSTNALDLSTLTWSDEILKASKLDPSLFPDLMPSTAVIGELTASVAKECGLAAGTPIVLGAGDGVCAATGAASVSSGDAYHYLGSSSWIAYTADAPLYDPEMRTFNWVHMVPGKFCPTGTMQAAGNSFNYIRDMLCDGEEIRAKANGQTVYDAINRMLRESPIGSRGIIYLPYLLGERSPRWNPIARGAYIGLTMEHSRSDLVHAALEGVLMNLSIILECFRKQQPIDSLRLIGGLAQSDEICKMLADIFGVRAVLMDKLEEATSMGAAVCGGVGVGVLPDFTSVHRFIHPDKSFGANMEKHAAYAPVKALFESCYQAMLPLYQKIAEL